MRTTLKIAFAETSTIPGLKAHAHDLPGFPDVTCIDFLNDGNKEVPRAFQHIMLVPDDMRAPDLGRDRTPYLVPANYSEVELSIDLGIVGDRDFIVAQMIIRTSDGGTITHTHVPCELP